MNGISSKIEHHEEKTIENDHFNLLREINKKPKASQRELAKATGFSLGKLNYCIKALISKGLIKINNFEKVQIRLIIFMF